MMLRRGEGLQHLEIQNSPLFYFLDILTLLRGNKNDRLSGQTCAARSTERQDTLWKKFLIQQRHLPLLLIDVCTVEDRQHLECSVTVKCKFAFQLTACMLK